MSERTHVERPAAIQRVRDTAEGGAAPMGDRHRRRAACAGSPRHRREARRHHLAVEVPRGAPGRPAQLPARGEHQGDVLLQHRTTTGVSAGTGRTSRRTSPHGRRAPPGLRRRSPASRRRTTCTTRSHRHAWRELAPDAVVVALLRDPVERAFSHWKERCQHTETLSFADAVAAEADRCRGEEERILADPSYVSFAHRHQSYVAAELLRPDDRAVAGALSGRPVRRVDQRRVLRPAAGAPRRAHRAPRAAVAAHSSTRSRTTASMHPTCRPATRAELTERFRPRGRRVERDARPRPAVARRGGTNTLRHLLENGIP